MHGPGVEPSSTRNQDKVVHNNEEAMISIDNIDSDEAVSDSKIPAVTAPSTASAPRPSYENSRGIITTEPVSDSTFSPLSSKRNSEHIHSPRPDPSPKNYEYHGHDRQEKNMSNVAALQRQSNLFATDRQEPGEENMVFSDASGEPSHAGGDEAGPSSFTILSDHHHNMSWIDLAQQTVIGPSPHNTTRPTSVPLEYDRPIYKNASVSHPKHLDQTRQAPESHQSPPHQQPPPLRTRSSNPAQHTAYVKLSMRKSHDFSSVVAGARTVGSTPSQSPGFSSPSYARSKASTEDLEDLGYQTPQLHPTHNQPPIETHKLQKDIDPISGDKRINKYQMIRRLGNGQHGTVKLAKNLESNEEVAVKIVRRFAKRSLRRATDPNEMVKKEVAILKKARHPHIVSLLEVIDDVDFNKVYLILEFVAFGEIVWRKQTVRDVAVFEMDRVRREKTGMVDPAFEMAEIDNFNNHAISRRKDKARVVMERKQEAGEVVEPGHWSLEFGNGSEDEQMSEHDESYGTQTRTIDWVDHDSNHPCSERDESTGEEVTRFSEMMQSGTPKALPRTVNLDELPDESNLDTQADDEHELAEERRREASDTRLRTMITDFIDTENEWTPEEDEYRFVACLTISQARDAFRDTVLGLEYLHYQGIIHRDIKPANLLWTAEQRVKISDFGVSYLGKPIREDDDPADIPDDDTEILDEAIELAKTRGTPAFYAPELCDPDLFDEQKTPVRPQITGQIDVWALGVTLYCMIFGRLPFIDESEMAMYEKIAHEPVFVPHVRLKAVEDSAKAPMGSNKRLDDLVEYEDVGEELADLLKRLLDKSPTQRITLREVKQHPWVLQGIHDQALWVDETDPSVQSQGKKIEVSNEEVQDAVVGLSLREMVKSVSRRVNSVLGRGRDGRKRGDQHSKSSDRSKSNSTSKTSATGQESRRGSLKDADIISQALRASRERESLEHPLAQSQVPSSGSKYGTDYFDKLSEDQSHRAHMASPGQGLDRTISNADSMRTIRPPASGFGNMSNRSSSEFIASLTSSVVDGSINTVNALLGNRGLRSRDRDSSKGSPSHSSRTSSTDLNAQSSDDRHASASLGFSAYSAKGLFDPPASLKLEDPLTSPLPNVTSSPSRPRSSADPVTDLPYRGLEHNMRRGVLEQNTIAMGSASTGINTPGLNMQSTFPSTSSMDEEDLTGHVQVSSSSEQIASGLSDQISHPSLPSVTSGGSTTSMPQLSEPAGMPKVVLTSAEPITTGESEGLEQPNDIKRQPHPTNPQLLEAARDEEDDAGYSGGQESDSDEDVGLVIAKI